MVQTAEQKRLVDHHQFLANWKNWGPYLSDRAWSTVREDYSENGEAWDYFPHDQARSRAYRWNEDGIGGISDRNQYLCFAPAFWNEKDHILKERFFGLTSKEGNHGEDVKEYYFYLDSTPTHSYMKMLYKYPQKAYPYQDIVEENQRRGSLNPEYELIDTGVFNENRYFDIEIVYAKVAPDDILIKISAKNQGPEAAPLHILPTLWFRNTWSWGYPKGPNGEISQDPILKLNSQSQESCIEAIHPVLGHYYLYAQGSPEWLFTENNTNNEKIYHQPNKSPFVKDAFHHFLIEKDEKAINPERIGTKSAAHFERTIEPGEIWTIHLRLSSQPQNDPFSQFYALLEQRQEESDQFYASIQNPQLDEDKKRVQRQAFANLLWCKQFYYYDIEQWVNGDKSFFPIHRRNDRNQEWVHLFNFDILSMPDKWEYPWFASWDLSFHCIPLALIDVDFAKRQLTLMTREWYMHPNGQIPAYEWSFSDVTPPVVSWAAMRVYEMDAKRTEKPDRAFLVGMYQKSLLNFTWWVNRKDPMGLNVFEGGFLGVDNISIFNRSIPLSGVGRIDQSDATAWVGFYCIIMLRMSLELAKEESVYQDSATKFFEHFLRIATAMIHPQRKGYSLWDEEDGFFYDVLHFQDNRMARLKIRSMVGLMPLLSVIVVNSNVLEHMPIFHKRILWFLSQRPDYTSTVTCSVDPSSQSDKPRHILSMLTYDRLLRVLRYLFDENEFLSPYGIRSVSKYHEQHPFTLNIGNQDYVIRYEGGETSERAIAGGNSNWRGPIWFPINFLLIEALQKYHSYYGDSLKVEFPTGSGNWITLAEAANKLSQRLMFLFLKRPDGTRPIYPHQSFFNQDPHWQDLLLFNEYFNADTGLGLGASHQGWTTLVATLLQQSHDAVQTSPTQDTWTSFIDKLFHPFAGDKV